MSNPGQSPGRQLDALESLRGVAALMVLFYHLAELVKIPLPASLGFISSHFGLGVPLFYALSGFVLSYGYASKLEGRPRIMAFYVRRLFRIAPLFYTMLVLWLVVNYVLWDKVFSSQTLFLNVTFLFGLVPGFHESVVWAGWSIGIEMLFYLVFPVLILFAHDVKLAVAFYVVALVLGTAIQNALLGMDVGSYAYMNLGTHLPSFAAGIACFRIWEGARYYRNPVLGWVLLAGFLVAAVVTIGCVWLVSEIAFRFIETPGIDLGRRVAARYAAPARAQG